ncbi:hypothetical protein BAY40_09465 [Limosilactobacillus reuteri]|nr:hypothetical protein BAY40_09465 [Limosilactobacillus reuteri]
MMVDSDAKLYHEIIIQTGVYFKQRERLVTSFFDAKLASWVPPQATIGLQCSVLLPGVGGHCCTAPFVFCENNLAYVTVPLKLIF